MPLNAFESNQRASPSDRRCCAVPAELVRAVVGEGGDHASRWRAGTSQPYAAATAGAGLIRYRDFYHAPNKLDHDVSYFLAAAIS